MNCFVHGVSPVKDATNNKRKYFNCTLQCEDKKVIRAVCFSPKRQNQIKMLSQTRSLVKVQNFQLQYEDSGPDGDIVITKYTKIAPIKKDVNFTFSDKLIASSSNVELSSLNNLLQLKLKLSKSLG